MAKFEREIKYQVINKNGKRGIRTLGTNNSYSGLAIRRFSPLSHLSQLKKIIIMLHYTWNKDWKKLSFSVFIYIIYLQLLLAIPFRSSKDSKDSIERKKIERKKKRTFLLLFCSKGPFFTPVAWPGHYLAGPFLFQRILAKTIYLIWKQKRFAIKATTKRRRNIFILIIQNQSVISYYSFFLFYFLDNLILTGIKKNYGFLHNAFFCYDFGVFGKPYLSKLLQQKKR